MLYHSRWKAILSRVRRHMYPRDNEHTSMLHEQIINLVNKKIDQLHNLKPWLLAHLNQIQNVCTKKKKNDKSILQKNLPSWPLIPTPQIDSKWGNYIK